MRLDEDRYYGAKVPEITVSFWVAKIISTAMGEATSDFLVFHTNPYLAVAAGGLGFALALALQFATRRHVPAAYWLLVVMVAIFGTMVADVIHVVLGVPYAISTVLFAAGLLLILWGWRASERSLSIHTVVTPRREAFYWATVSATFALGTAAGDLTAATFGMGYLNSAILFSILFALPGLAYVAFGLNEVAAFWTAYIMTRPMGPPSPTGSTSRCRAAGLAMARRLSRSCSPPAWGSRFCMSACGIGGSARPSPRAGHEGGPAGRGPVRGRQNRSLTPASSAFEARPWPSIVAVQPACQRQPPARSPASARPAIPSFAGMLWP